MGVPTQFGDGPEGTRGAGAGSSCGAPCSLAPQGGGVHSVAALSPATVCSWGYPPERGRARRRTIVGGLLAARIPMGEPTHLGDGPEGVQVDEDGGAPSVGFNEKTLRSEMEAQELRVVPLWSRGTSPSGHIDRR